MTPRERFVHFVAVFAKEGGQDLLVQEALELDPKALAKEPMDEEGNLEPAPLERPMEAAWEFVQHRKNGSYPFWYPRIVPPTTRLIR